jgi:hypothetical protein
MLEGEGGGGTKLLHSVVQITEYGPIRPMYPCILFENSDSTSSITDSLLPND